MLFPVIAVCFFLQTEPVRLYPFDESHRDSSFRSYVARLRAAVETRSTSALRRLVDEEEVVVGPAKDDKGWARFLERWRPDEGADSPVWPALADLLSLGFIREQPYLFLSPYLVWRFPDHLNMATHLVVVRDKVALRETPSIRAPIASWLSFDIVRRLGPVEGSDELQQWVPVSTLDGKEGFVNTRDVMSPLMARAQFANVRGRWLLVALEGPAR
jgi:hypothetical protein